MFARVSFPISSFKIFTYKIPEFLYDIIEPGSCVNAPIKRRLQAGFVIAVNAEPVYKGKILEIDSIRENDFHLPTELWQTLEWISRYYITPIGQVLKAAVPNSFIKAYQPQNVQFVKINSSGLKKLQDFDKSKPAQKRILKALSCIEEPVKTASLKEFATSPHTVCRQLDKAGLIETIFQPNINDPFDIMGPGEKKNIQLSREQKSIVDTIQSSEKGFHPYLLHGVTGSGKTEVYLKLAQAKVESGKSVLVLEK